MHDKFVVLAFPQDLTVEMFGQLLHELPQRIKDATFESLNGGRKPGQLSYEETDEWKKAIDEYQQLTNGVLIEPKENGEESILWQLMNESFFDDLIVAELSTGIDDLGGLILAQPKKLQEIDERGFPYIKDRLVKKRERLEGI